MKNLMVITFLILITFNSNILNAQTALTNTFTYQGELKFNNVLADGIYDFEFSVFDVLTGGVVLEMITVNGVAVTNGVFSTPITLTNDLFTGNKVWLNIAVRENGSAVPFDLLAPRQEVTSSPYAIHAQFVGTDAVTSTQIFDGTITANDINTGSVQSRVSGACALGRYMQSVNSDGTINCAGNAIGVTEGVGIGTANTNGYQLNVLGSSYLRNDLNTSTTADLVLGGAIGNASDDGVLTSDLSIAGSDLIIKSNDAIVMDVGGSSATGGALTVRSGVGVTLLQVKGDGVVNIPGSLNVTGSITIPNNSVSSNQLAAFSVNRSEISGTEILLYRISDNCRAGGLLDTANTCQTLSCANTPITLYYSCTGTTCGVPTQQTCSNIAIGYLLSPQIGL